MPDKYRSASLLQRIGLLCTGMLLPVSIAFAASKAVHPVTPAQQDWPTYGGQPENDHYSPLTQINRRNVKDLKKIWEFDTGESGSLQTNPMIVGRVLYGYTPMQKVFALDAATGKLLWKFDPGIGHNEPRRGFAWWTDGRQERLFAMIMSYVYALDAKTGKPIESFGENGRIDLRKNLGSDDYRSQSVTLTSPGRVYKDLLIMGFRTSETPPAPHGDIRAYDTRTGKLRWVFHTIPHPDEPGYDTWPAGAWKTAGSANNWAGMAVDEKRGIVYVPTGSAVPDFYGASRIGNDLYANCLLALDANTGKLLWYFQGVHHDMWDRDFPSPPTLLTVTRDGKKIDAVAETSKQGYVYVFDRVTGKPLFPIEEKPYPPSDVPGEKASPTQPTPLAPEPFEPQHIDETQLTDRTPEAHIWAVKTFRTFRNGGPFTPFTVGKKTVIFPGYDGGAEWGGSAADPRTGVLYVNSNQIMWTGELAENHGKTGSGAWIYQNECAVCHGEDRRGSPNFPSLVDINKRISEQQIVDTIHGGKGRMPSFPGIRDAELDRLVHYLETGQDLEPGEKVAHAATPASQQPIAVAGKHLYEKNCALCHGEDRNGEGRTIPRLLGIGDRLSEEQLLTTIRNGNGRMPAFPESKLSSNDLDALLLYLGTSNGAPAAKYTPSTEDETAENPGREMVSKAEIGSQPPRYRFTGYEKFYDPDGYPANAPPWGTLNAIDLNTGKYLWKIPFGYYPELAMQGMGNTGSENYGGPILTASGLVLIASTVYDKMMHAYNSRTGKLLWKYELPYAGVATPATYMVDGRQYVVIAASGGRDPKSPSEGTYVAFALP